MADGPGTGLREDPEFKSKFLVEIGGKPITWHAINYYQKFNVNDFIVLQAIEAAWLKNAFLQMMN